MVTFIKFMNFGRGPVACFNDTPFGNREFRLDEKSLLLRINNLQKGGYPCDMEEAIYKAMIGLK